MLHTLVCRLSPLAVALVFGGCNGQVGEPVPLLAGEGGVNDGGTNPDSGITRPEDPHPDGIPSEELFVCHQFAGTYSAH